MALIRAAVMLHTAGAMDFGSYVMHNPQLG